MTFLPIVDRELRVTARQPSTYWIRFFVVLLALAVFVILLLGSRRTMPSVMGQNLLGAISVLALIFTSLAGVFATSDCLSQEKREGTLGLLFLTDLRGYDVVLGKLVASSVQSFFALLAMFPVMALPVLLGGVTGAEFARMIIALSATLFFSLAVGMVVSLFCWETRQAMAMTLIVLVIFLGLFPLLWWAQKLGFKGTQDWLLWPNPVFMYLTAFDSSYRTSSGPVDFWSSFATVLTFALGFIIMTSLLLPRIWHDKGDSRDGQPGFWQRRRYGSVKVRAQIRTVLMNINPFLWLTCRDRLSKVTVNDILRIVAPIWLSFLVAALTLPTARGPGAMPKNIICFIICLFTAFALHQMFKIIVAMEATRRFSDDRQNGALELILVTPVSARSIIEGQIKGIQRHFRPGLWAITFLNLILLYALWFHGKNLDLDRTEEVYIFSGMFVGGILLLHLDFLALSRFGMASALTAKKHHRAVLKTLGAVSFLPWCAIFVIIFIMSSGGVSGSDFEAFLIFWYLGAVLLDCLLIGRANVILGRGLRRIVQPGAVSRLIRQPIGRH